MGAATISSPQCRRRCKGARLKHCFNGGGDDFVTAMAANLTRTARTRRFNGGGDDFVTAILPCFNVIPAPIVLQWGRRRFRHRNNDCRCVAGSATVGFNGGGDDFVTAMLLGSIGSC